MNIKLSILPLAIVASIICVSTVNSQTAKTKPGAAPAAAPATTPAAPAKKTTGGKEIEGRWKIDHIDVKMVTPEGEESKNTMPGNENDYFDMSNGVMTSHVMEQEDKVPYTIVGKNIISKSEEKTDTICILTLTKEKCVLFKKEETPEGNGEFTITMKR